MMTAGDASAVKGVRGGRPHFRPTSIDNLVIWLRADLGVTLVGSGVSQWADQSGNGNHVAQASSGLRPTVGTLAGQAAIQFTAASNQFLDGAIAGLSGGGDLFAFCVMEWTDLAATPAIAWELYGSGGNRSAYFIHIAPDVFCRVMATGNPNGSETFFQDVTTGAHIYGTVHTTGGRVFVHDNRPQPASDRTATTQAMHAPTNLRLGRLSGGSILYPLGGKVSEFVIYSRCPDIAQYDALQTYFSERYGITIADGGLPS